jgi:aromatic-L-amino-acid decarboxylase
MILRYFGAEGLRARLAEHVRLAQMFAGWVDAAPGWERVAPVPFSVVCFRAVPDGLGDPAAIDALNQQLLDAVNRTGEVFLSHTNLEGRFVLRLAVGNIRTRDRHVARAWALLQEHAARLRA